MSEHHREHSDLRQKLISVLNAIVNVGHFVKGDPAEVSVVRILPGFEVRWDEHVYVHGMNICIRLHNDREPYTKNEPRSSACETTMQ